MSDDKPELEEANMKVGYLLPLMVLVMAMSLWLVAGCGGDDDDDDDDGGSGDGTSCEQACAVVYDDCQMYLEDEDEAPMSRSECVDFCISEGGMNTCTNACFTQFEEDGTCTPLLTCLYDCIL